MIRSRTFPRLAFPALLSTLPAAIGQPSHDLTGSRWKVIWERIDTGGNVQPYDSSGETSLHLTFTENGFITDEGYQGLWTWRLYPGGRLVIHINDNHPPGHGCYFGAGQAEILVNVPDARERIRWVRQRSLLPPS